MILNRSGVALMESCPGRICAHPSKLLLFLGNYAPSCVISARVTAIWTDACADVVSVRKPGGPLARAPKSEWCGSLRRRLNEARRQVDLIESGGTVVQETRLFDSKLGETRSMRSKEEAHDYRYFPDPDLLPLELDQAWVDEIAKSLPELPDEKKERLMQAGLSAYDATVIVGERETADYFEAMVAAGASAKSAANWLNNEYFGRLNKAGLTIDNGPISAEANSAIVQMIDADVISGKIAKDLVEIVWNEGGDPKIIVETRGMRQVTDTGAIEKAVDDVIAANPDKVEQVKAKPKMAAWFVGQVMKATGGKANPQAVNAVLKVRLNLPDDE